MQVFETSVITGLQCGQRSDQWLEMDWEVGNLEGWNANFATQSCHPNRESEGTQVNQFHKCPVGDSHPLKT